MTQIRVDCAMQSLHDAETGAKMGPKEAVLTGATTPHAELRGVIGQLTTLGGDLEAIAGRFATASGLHATDVRALRVLSDATTNMTAGELGQRLLLTSGATTRMIDRMERAGYLARARSDSDRRVVHVQMTQQAWDAVGDFFGRLGPVIDDALGNRFSGADLDIIARFLTAAGTVLHQVATESTRG